MNRHRAFAALLCAATLSSCEKNAVQEIAGAAPAARIKFFNFGVNSPGVNFYANDTKMTAIISASGTESVTGVTYSNVGSGGLYAGIEPGQYTLSGRIAAATDKDVSISSLAATIEAGKQYSFYQSGIYDATTKTVDAFLVEDPFIAEIDHSVAYVRFVNAISNANPMTLHARDTVTKAEVAIGDAVAYKSAGVFTAVPHGVYTLTTKYVGSATNVIKRPSVSFVAGRVYTISARGDITITSTTHANRPLLDNTLNR